jgi:hypothetical protein
LYTRKQGTSDATPAWQQGTALEEKAKKTDSSSIVGALGEIRELSGKMLVAYSVRNQSDHWIEVLPPQIEISGLGDKSQIKKKDRKHIVEAEQVRSAHRDRGPGVHQRNPDRVEAGHSYRSDHHRLRGCLAFPRINSASEGIYCILGTL